MAKRILLAVDTNTASESVNVTVDLAELSGADARQADRVDHAPWSPRLKRRLTADSWLTASCACDLGVLMILDGRPAWG